MGLTVTDAKSVFEGAAAAPYDAYAGWDTTWQPADTAALCHSPEEYCYLASHAIGPFRNKIESFLQRQGLTYIAVPHRVFHEQYERAKYDEQTMRCTFDEWVNKLRADRGVSYYPDVIFIEPSTKAEERSDSKAIFDNPNFHANKDYLRAMCIFTATGSAASKKAGLRRLGDAKASIIEDPYFGPTARKDQLARPHSETGYRGLHVTTTCVADDDSFWSGVGITAELKLESSLHQDVYRMTREMQEVRRGTKARLTEIQTSHPTSGRMPQLISNLNVLAMHLHDFVSKREGMDIFLAPHIQTETSAQRAVLSPAELAAEMKAMAWMNARLNHILSRNPLGIPGLGQPVYQSTAILTP